MTIISFFIFHIHNDQYYASYSVSGVLNVLFQAFQFSVLELSILLSILYRNPDTILTVLHEPFISNLYY